MLRKHRLLRSSIAPAVFLLWAMLALLAPAPPLVAQDEPDEPLRVATKPLEPFVFLEGEQPAGYSIDLWNELAERLGLEYEWVEYETVAEILAAVENGEADAAIAGISMTRERESVLDFSHPYFDAGLQILVPDGGSFAIGDLLRQIVAPGLWLFLLLAIVAAFVMAHAIWLYERRINPDFPRGYLAGVWEGLWWLVTIVANAEYPDKPTQLFFRRAMTIAFWLVGLLLVAQFTAVVTSALTVQRLSGSIDGPEDLPGKRVATVEGSTGAIYLDEQGVGYFAVRTVDEAYDLLVGGEVDAIVYDAPVLQYYVITGGRGIATTAGGVFRPEKYGIALQNGSDLREPLNATLLALYQDGTLGAIYERWFTE